MLNFELKYLMFSSTCHYKLSWSVVRNDYFNRQVCQYHLFAKVHVQCWWTLVVISQIFLEDGKFWSGILEIWNQISGLWNWNYSKSDMRAQCKRVRLCAPHGPCPKPPRRPLGGTTWGTTSAPSPASGAASVGKISAKCCSFSVVSAPIFATKYAFCSIFQNLPDS